MNQGSSTIQWVEAPGKECDGSKKIWLATALIDT